MRFLVHFDSMTCTILSSQFAWQQEFRAAAMGFFRGLKDVANGWAFWEERTSRSDNAGLANAAEPSLPLLCSLLLRLLTYLDVASV
jgi:hypothetical protein